MERTLLIVATETSGDIHGGNLARELRKQDPSLRLIGAGGTHMKEAGVEILADPTAHASIGIVEAFQNMHRFAKLYRLLQSSLRNRRPGAVVLIDSPDFNLRLAERIVDHGIPVIYYISPQIWAWRAGRIKTIKRLVRKMIVILDFEEKLYRDAGVDVSFVGHPLLDARKDIDRDAFRREIKAGKTLIGLLPGSRNKQFKSLFPILKKTADLIGKDRPDTRFVVACAPNINPKGVLDQGLELVWNRTPEVMASSDLIITASGTATLEAAIYGTPMIVTYRLNPLTAYAFGPLVWLNTKDFSLVNIVAGKRIMPEMYQSKAKPRLLANEALDILKNDRLGDMRKALEEVRGKLGGPGASRRAAREVLNILPHPG